MSGNKAPENETKAEKSKRLMDKRMTVARKRLSLILNLAKGNQYEYTEEQKTKVLETLKSDILKIETAFSGNNKKEDLEFNL